MLYLTHNITEFIIYLLCLAGFQKVTAQNNSKFLKF